MSKKYYLYVHNTMSGKTEKVEVAKEIYDEFRRGEWRISKNNSKYSANEIVFSSLLGGKEDLYENFHEFIDCEANPERILLHQQMIEDLYLAIEHLSKVDRLLIKMLYFDGLSERELASIYSVAQTTIHKKKRRILKILRKFLT